VALLAPHHPDGMNHVVSGRRAGLIGDDVAKLYDADLTAG
jgi:hypothetical protein